jgi:osmotically-inducible protein OsmY
MMKLAVGAAIGALGALFLDPANGKRRRHTLRDRTVALVRRIGRRSERLGRGVAAEGYGVVQKAKHIREEPKEYDDATLKAKVETELFRAADAPKGQVSVNAQSGIIQLRGELESEDMIEDLVRRAKKVQGVRDVESLLHVSGTHAPMHE